ncbi:MAG: restriction endonuclease subunit S, partial [Sulfurimonas sp.]|nr:restriction endonuclease subunit S [Sulfurimonas sp.]
MESKNLPDGWEEQELNALIDIKHGYAFKGKNFTAKETSLIVLTPGNFKIGGGFKKDKFKFHLENEKFPLEYILNTNYLIITMTDLSIVGDTLGYPTLGPELENKQLLHNQRLGKVIFKTEKIGKYFLYYALCTNDYRHEVLATVTGTTVKHTAPSRILKYKLKYPSSIVQQKKIASILSSLDDKIECNNKMNQTLEKMAQSIFKEWFEEFNFPNAEGKPYKTNKGAMQTSELGEIPEGWEVKVINSLFSVKDGTHDSPKNKNIGHPLITSKHIKNNQLNIANTNLICQEDFDKINKRSLVQTNDILIGMIGTVGDLYLVT